MNNIFILIFSLLLAGHVQGQGSDFEHKSELASSKISRDFDTVPAPAGKKRSVAVYGFPDKTERRSPANGVAGLPAALAQGAEVFLIKALQDVGHGQWFEVVERINLDVLARERMIIQKMREVHEGANAKPLVPMLLADVIMEGGIIGYESGSEMAGAACRFLGLDDNTQYSKETVIIGLRAISVDTGKVLAAVHVTKTVYSTAGGFAVPKLLDNGTQAFEAETGLAAAEPGTWAVKASIEAAVVELIKEAERKHVWEYRKPEVASAPEVVARPPPAVVAAPAPSSAVLRPEVKKIAKVKVAGPGYMYFLSTTKVYRRKSNLKGPLYGPFVSVVANTAAVVAETDFEDVLAVTTKAGVRGFVRRERLRVAK